MVAYSVTGTKHFVAGKGTKWFAYLNEITVGKRADAGPFTSRKSAIEWIGHYETYGGE